VNVPTPFGPAHVSGYLFPSEPVTVVDPGPRLETTLPCWEHALAAHGLRFADVDQIVVTHQHWDHLGGAADLKALTGAPVLGVPGVRPYLADFGTAIGLEVEAYHELMGIHGVPGPLRDDSLAVFATLPDLVGSLHLDREVVDGDTVQAGGRDLLVCARPGHSPTDTLFVDTETRVALVGDHLLEDFPPVFMPIVPGPTPVDADLITMLASLEATAALELSCGLTGHGRAVVDVADTAARWATFYRRHDAQILGLLDGYLRGAWDLTTTIYDEMRQGTPLYKLLAVLGALEVLESEHAVERIQGDTGPVFKRV
jgi:glyoxylase-like metal-dependent hydrolase (beta-lactamase superfamily II)